MFISKQAQQDREDEAWLEGHREADEAWEEHLADKDAFIAEQAGLLQQVAELPEDVIDWMRVPEPLRNRLADYL